MSTRRIWKCPQCERRWDIPAGFEPKGCPRCVPAAADSPSADSRQRELPSFSAPVVGEGSSGAHRRADRTVHDVKQPASERDFFVPLPTESRGLDAAVAEEPVVFHKRKQRSEIPLGAVVACLAGCLLIVGLIVYQKTKGPTAAANAIKGRVAGQLERPGAAASPIAAGKPDGRMESAAGKDQKTHLGVGKALRGEIPSPEGSDVAGATSLAP